MNGPARLYALDHLDMVKYMVAVAIERIAHAMQTQDDGLEHELLEKATDALKHAHKLMSAE